MQWNGGDQPADSRRAPLRSVLESILGKAAPYIQRYGDSQLPGAGNYLNSVARSGAEMTPGVGDLVGLEDLQTAAQNNDWGGIGLGLLAAIPGIPAIGKGVRGEARAARRGLGLLDAAPAPREPIGLMGQPEYRVQSSQDLAPTDTPESLRAQGYEIDPQTNTWARYVTENRRLPQSEALVSYNPPSVAEMQRFGRVERVPLNMARSSQSWMDWDRVNSGVRPGDMVEGYGDKALAVRREDGEYVLLDGHHRTVRDIEGGALDSEMYVIDAKDVAPDIAGRKPKPVQYDRQEIDDLLAALGVR